MVVWTYILDQPIAATERGFEYLLFYKYVFTNDNYVKRYKVSVTDGSLLDSGGYSLATWSMAAREILFETGEVIPEGIQKPSSREMEVLLEMFRQIKTARAR